MGSFIQLLHTSRSWGLREDALYEVGTTNVFVHENYYKIYSKRPLETKRPNTPTRRKT